MKTFLAQVTPADPNAGTPTTAPAHSSVENIMIQLGVESTWRETEWWGWVALLGCIFLGVIAGRVTSGFMRKTADRAQGRGAVAAATVVRSAATPASLFLITVGISVGLGFIDLQPVASSLRNKVLTFLYVLAVAWFLFNLVDLIDIWVRNLATRTKSHIDDQLAPLIRKTLRIFLVILVGLYTAQNIFNQDVTAWLTGLGIAGLAVSLAAQDSLRNLFGSITILLDKPFEVGDRIVFDGFDGPVEEIGFRSTRMRNFDGELITVPNSKFIEGSVRNVTKRPTIRRVMDVSVEYGTSPELMRQAVEAIRKILDEPEIRLKLDWEKTPPRVHFNEMKADNLNIRVSYWFSDPADWWGFNDLAQHVNLRVMEELTAIGVPFAFPTQTMVLTNDGDKPLRVETRSAPE